MPEKLKKEDIWSIPNLLSLFRMILIPFIIWLYCTKDDYFAAFALVVLSGLTDILDGKIARKYNMITSLGKILDPIADKLTQAALIICLISRYRLMWALIGLFVLKEVVSAAFGYLSVKASDSITGAKWYGKVNTVLLYAVMIVLIVFPEIPLGLANGLIGLCAVSLIVTFVFYMRLFCSMVAKGQSNLPKNIWRTAARIICLCLWVVVLLFGFIYREQISIDVILRVIPHNSWLVALALLGIFAGKSLGIFVYTGLLFAASGAFFSPKLAFAVNITGTVAMLLFPYCFGRAAGADGMKKLSENNAVVHILQRFPDKSSFFSSFISRIGGILPVDAVSFCLGNLRTEFPAYFFGSLLGIAPSLVAFTVMGLRLDNPASPAFTVSLLVQCSISALSLLIYFLYHRHYKKTNAVG